MRFGNHADDINAWWETIPGERYWLDVTERDDHDNLLAAPLGEGRSAATSTHRLITHVRAGDVVFHFDVTKRTIASCSIALGRVEKRQLAWPQSERAAGDEQPRSSLPCWCIELQPSARLSDPVSLRDIARVQHALFPRLRALEDEFGDPLYYPFEIGNGESTHPLGGFVFKLPAVFVESISELANATACTGRRVADRERAPSFSTPGTTVPHAS